MSLSAFDLFKIGIGPSSSHTVGPMRAAERFLRELETLGLLERTARLETLLYQLSYKGNPGAGCAFSSPPRLQGGLSDRVVPFKSRTNRTG